MASIQAILAVVARVLGRVLGTAFGWATVLLFGKVPEERQIYLSIASFGSVIWLITLLGIAFPSFATFMLAFVRVPESIDRTWVRLAMLAIAVVIPLVVGFIALRMLHPSDRPPGAVAQMRATLKGYPYTLGLALTFLMMIFVAPVLQIRTLLKRWATQHVPVLVEPADYEEVVRGIREALRQGGWETAREPASLMLRLPTKVLTLLSGGAIARLVADQLVTLRADQLEIILHPSDLVISGQAANVADAQAIIAEQLAFSPAYMTWTKEANEIEDRLDILWRQMKKGSPGFLREEAPRALQTIERDLRALRISYKEWEVLFREKLMVERALLQVAAGVTARPKDLTEVDQEQVGAAGLVRLAWMRDQPLLPTAAILVVALAAGWLGLRVFRNGGTESRRRTMDDE